MGAHPMFQVSCTHVHYGPITTRRLDLEWIQHKGKSRACSVWWVCKDEPQLSTLLQTSDPLQNKTRPVPIRRGMWPRIVHFACLCWHTEYFVLSIMHSLRQKRTRAPGGARRATKLPQPRPSCLPAPTPLSPFNQSHCPPLDLRTSRQTQVRILVFPFSRKKKKKDFCLALPQPMEATEVVFPIRNLAARWVYPPHREVASLRGGPGMVMAAQAYSPLDSETFEVKEHVFSSFRPNSWQTMKLSINIVGWINQ